MARRFETGILRVFSGSEKDGVSAQEGHAWIVEGLREGATYAEQLGVTLALENHGLFAGRAEQVRAILEEVGSPALRANLDTGNFLLVNQDPVDAVAAPAALAAYVHLKDFRKVRPDEQVREAYTGLDGSRCVGTVIGAGEVDLRAVLAALRAGGYDGWLSIEYEGVGDAKQEVEESLHAAQSLVPA
jgi:sugar phosphate isomerase/epimerase